MLQSSLGHRGCAGASRARRRPGRTCRRSTGLSAPRGRAISRAVEQGFFKNGITTVRLEVRTSNDAAQKLYFHLGYKIVRRMPRYYTSGDDGYLMVKNLA